MSRRRTARWIAMALTWTILAFDIYLAFFVRAAQWLIVLVFFGSLIPYLVYLNFVEPWLDRHTGRPPTEVDLQD